MHRGQSDLWYCIHNRLLEQCYCSGVNPFWWSPDRKQTWNPDRKRIEMLKMSAKDCYYYWYYRWFLTCLYKCAVFLAFSLSRSLFFSVRNADLWTDNKSTRRSCQHWRITNFCKLKRFNTELSVLRLFG